MSKRRADQHDCILSPEMAQVGVCRQLNSTRAGCHISSTDFRAGAAPNLVTSTNSVACGGRSFVHAHVVPVSGTADWLFRGWSPVTEAWHIVGRRNLVGAASSNAFRIDIFGGFSYIGASCTNLVGSCTHRCSFGG